MVWGIRYELRPRLPFPSSPADSLFCMCHALRSDRLPHSRAIMKLSSSSTGPYHPPQGPAIFRPTQTETLTSPTAPQAIKYTNRMGLRRFLGQCCCCCCCCCFGCGWRPLRCCCADGYGCCCCRRPFLGVRFCCCCCCCCLDVAAAFAEARSLIAIYLWLGKFLPPNLASPASQPLRILNCLMVTNLRFQAELITPGCIFADPTARPQDHTFGSRRGGTAAIEMTDTHLVGTGRKGV